MGMGEHGPNGKWIAPEDVPDPIALRGLRASEVRTPEEPRRVALPTIDIAALDLGTLDPLDPPSLEVVQVVRPDGGALTEFTLEPTPPPALTSRRRVPAAVWVGGTMLVVAVLSMGLRWLTAVQGSPAADPADASPAAVRPHPAPAIEPVPVDEQAASAVDRPAPPARSARQRRAEAPPPQASVRPIGLGQLAPPSATVRPLTPAASASLETETESPAVNPWADVEP